MVHFWKTKHKRNKAVSHLYRIDKVSKEKGLFYLTLHSKEKVKKVKQRSVCHKSSIVQEEMVSYASFVS